MRKGIKLYIGNRLADLQDDSLILYNYTREEMSDPAVVKNSYSQQVTLPSTPANDAIFGHFYKADRQQVSNGVVGSGFNPLNKTQFSLYNDRGEILESGYCKLSKVANDGKGKRTYHINLYGGLGEFFYNLSYYEDGTKKTLADLIYYPGLQDDEPFNPKEERLYLTKNHIYNAWDNLNRFRGTYVYGFINFAPCNNGIPSNFDAKHAVYRENGATSSGGRIPNLYVSATKDGKAYGTQRNSGGYVVVELENDHDEFEMQDMRSYLQRPVIRLKYMIEAMCRPENNGGYSVDFMANNTDEYVHWEDGWMTLPIIDREKVDLNRLFYSDLLTGTNSPAEYLISWCKMWGFVFICDKATKHITICNRNDLYWPNYSPAPVDLSKMIDTGRSITIEPYLITSQRYVWKYPTMVGAFCENYLATYGKAYGSMSVDTAYQFGDVENDILKSIVFKGATDSMEKSVYYSIYGGWSDPNYGGYNAYNLKFAYYEGVKWRLYNYTGNEETSQEFAPTETGIDRMYYNQTDNGFMFMSMPQFHDKENKPVDGSNVLLFYDKCIEMPRIHMGSLTLFDARFYISDDNAYMLNLNGKPCWDITEGSGTNNLRKAIGFLPHFSRFMVDSQNRIYASWDFAPAKEVSIPGVSYYLNDLGIYKDQWREYIADRLNVNTKVMTCFVHWGITQVNEELLRKFYWYDNALWVLNKIKNYSVNSLDPCECEFVRVQDKHKYVSQYEI